MIVWSCVIYTYRCINSVNGVINGRQVKIAKGQLKKNMDRGDMENFGF